MQGRRWLMRTCLRGIPGILFTIPCLHLPSIARSSIIAILGFNFRYTLFAICYIALGGEGVTEAVPYRLIWVSRTTVGPSFAAHRGCPSIFTAQFSIWRAVWPYVSPQLSGLSLAMALSSFCRLGL